MFNESFMATLRDSLITIVELYKNIGKYVIALYTSKVCCPACHLKTRGQEGKEQGNAKQKPRFE